jgi:hypothetical protein
MPTIDLTDEEHAALTALIPRAIEEDKFPRAPRLDPYARRWRSSIRSAAALRRPLGLKSAKSAPTAAQAAQDPQWPPTGLLKPSMRG